MEKYRIATPISLFDINERDDYSEYIEKKLYPLQNELIDFYKDTYYIIKQSSNRNKTKYYTHYNLDDILQRIAIKEGIDIIEIKGHLAILAYYGTWETLVEFVELEKGIYDDLLELEEETPYYRLEDFENVAKYYFIDSVAIW